jgi:hypothetical protein
MQNFNRAADCKQYIFIKNYTHHRLKHSRIQRFENDTEDANTTNNIRNIKYSSRYQTQGHTPVIHGRSGLSYSPLDKVTEIAVVYEDHFRPPLKNKLSTAYIDKSGEKLLPIFNCNQ